MKIATELIRANWLDKLRLAERNLNAAFEGMRDFDRATSTEQCEKVSSKMLKTIEKIRGVIALIDKEV